MLEILIFGAMALLLAVKLRSILGQEYEESTRGKRGDRVKDISIKDIVSGSLYGGRAKSRHSANHAPVCSDSGAHIDPNKTVLLFDEKVITKSAFENFHLIMDYFPHLTPGTFVKISSNVLSELLRAYSNNDTESVSALMSLELASKTISAMRKIKEQEYKVYLVLVGSDVAQITKVSLINDLAAISVHFVSKQIYYIEDKDGNVVSGDRALEYEVSELWTFRKDIKDHEKNTWLLSDINNIV